MLTVTVRRSEDQWGNIWWPSQRIVTQPYSQYPCAKWVLDSHER